MSAILFYGLIAGGGFLLFLLFAPLPNRLFFLLNRLHFLFYRPLKYLIKKPSEGSRTLYLVLWPFRPLLSLITYVVAAPLRLLNALYFNIVLFTAWRIWSILCHLAVEIVAAVLPDGENMVIGVLLIPLKAAMIVAAAGWRLLLTLIDAPLFLIIDFINPAPLFFHGTGKNSAQKIIGTNRWIAGDRAWAGKGIYFGLWHTASHYALANNTPAIIAIRINPFFTYPIAVGKNNLVQSIGNNGARITAILAGSLFRNVEHYRNDRNWFEYAILQKESRPRKTFSIRIIGCFYPNGRVVPLPLPLFPLSFVVSLISAAAVVLTALYLLPGQLSVPDILSMPVLQEISRSFLPESDVWIAGKQYASGEKAVYRGLLIRKTDNSDGKPAGLLRTRHGNIPLIGNNLSPFFSRQISVEIRFTGKSSQFQIINIQSLP